MRFLISEFLCVGNYRWMDKYGLPALHFSVVPKIRVSCVHQYNQQVSETELRVQEMLSLAFTVQCTILHPLCIVFL